MSLSVFLIGVQHPPTSCQERAPLWSSEPANYCLGRRTPQRPRQTSRTSRRALPRPPSDREGKVGQTSGPLPPRPPPRLRLNGPDKHEQLKATRSRGGEGREEGGNARGEAREEMQRGLRVGRGRTTQNKESALCEWVVM